MRVGIGYDLHRLVEGRRLVLGGVDIPYSKGLEGHSDADVLVHAVADALLGAAGLGDIGEHFPDTDERYRNIASVLLLEEVKKSLLNKGYRIYNVDAVVVADKPSLMDYKLKMREKIASVLELGSDQVNVKATTREGLGFGSGIQEAVAAYAVAVLKEEGR